MAYTKMPRKGRVAFPMNSRQVTCIQCKKITTRKQTLARDVKLGSIFSQTKKKTRRTKAADGKEIARSPSIAVVSVERICRGGCKE